MDFDDDELHNGMIVAVDGLQSAETDGDESGPVSWWFVFEDMGKPNNTVTASLYEVSGRELSDARWKCELPTSPAPTFLQVYTSSNTDSSSNVIW